jgi:hypothetical protein
LIAASRDLLARGEDLEAVLGFLRAEDCHMGDCIDVTMELLGMQHRDAKRAVFHSQTWCDVPPVVEELHDSIERALIQLANEEPDFVSYKSGIPAESANS